MSVTEQAKAIIDALRAKHKSWRSVREHAAALPVEAGALARLLRRPELAGHVDTYAKASAAATEAQDRYKLWARSAASAAAVAACISGLLLYLRLSPGESFVGSALGAAYLLLVGGALVIAQFISRKGLYQAWVERRGEAEGQRIRHFKALIEASEPGKSGELPLPPLALEYVRAFLIDDQRKWFNDNAAKFDRQRRNWSRVRLVALLPVALGAVPTLMDFATRVGLGGMVPVDWLTAVIRSIDGQLFNLAGLVGAALQALLFALAGLSLADRNAKSYARMVVALDKLVTDHLPKAREAAARNDDREIERFWARLSFELMAEHREWGAALTTAQLLILDRIKDGAGGKSG